MRPKLKRLFISCISAVYIILTLFASPVYSAVTQIINYQGSLTDDLGNPVNNTVSITFSLYHVDSGPEAAVWTETQPAVVVINGLFNVQLGADTGNQLTTAIIDDPVFLGIQVDADKEMTPRQQITAAGFAFQAADAARLNGLRANQIAVPAGAVMHFNLPSCPTGWSEFAAAQGRTLVGATSNLGSTVGTALSDLEDRTHTHNVDPAVTVTNVSGNHIHSVDPPSDTTSSDGHNHIWSFRSNDGKAWNTYQLNGNSVQMSDWGNFGTGSTEFSTIRPLVEFEIQNNTFYTNVDTHSHTFNLGAFNTASGGTHGHTVDIPVTPTTSTSATMPLCSVACLSERLEI